MEFYKKFESIKKKEKLFAKLMILYIFFINTVTLIFLACKKDVFKNIRLLFL